MAEQPLPPPRGTLNVATWNVLLDKTRTNNGLITPQSERTWSLVNALDEWGPFDVVTIQEAQREEGSNIHNGEVLARALGYHASYWREHNQVSRHDEYIGMFGERVGNVEFFDVGYTKQAAITLIGGVAIVGLHLKREHWGPKRAEQMESVIERIGDYEQAIVMGDFNALRGEKARRMLGRTGFVSVFTDLDKPYPVTFPTPAYRDIMLTPFERRVVRAGVSLDDIYIKNLSAVDAGTLEGDTDHVGIWATVEM